MSNEKKAKKANTKKKANKKKKTKLIDINVYPDHLEDVNEYPEYPWMRALQATSIPEDSQNEIMESISKIKKTEAPWRPEMASPEDILGNSGSIRTVTIITETASWEDDKGNRCTYHMEPGRIAAQVGHAVSKLKLSYATWFGDEKSVVERLQHTPITSIVLVARDSDELSHISRLCIDRDIHAVEFQDNNDKIYTPGRKVLTAVSVGPIASHYLDGITDYLHLW